MENSRAEKYANILNKFTTKFLQLLATIDEQQKQQQPEQSH